MKVTNGSKSLIIITGIFLAILGTHNGPTSSAAESTNMSAKETYQLIQSKGNKDIVVLDIRTPGEFAAGHIENAINIDYFSQNFASRLNQLDKNKTYVMHCKSGGRSSRALSIFEDLKFKNLIHLSGGFDEWSTNGLPVVK